MKVTLIDPTQFPTESTAMLQALYSRSNKSVDDHINNQSSEQLEASMKKFYVGYGHKSIGDCASTTLFIENVSVLAAKAIQDFFAYKGQECSTRYIDFKESGYVLPESTSEELKWVPERCIELYEQVRDAVYENLKATKEMPEGVKESVWDKTLRARAFDVARGWLPAGVKTNLSWHADLRQLSDRIELLIHHPLEEVSEIFKEIREQCLKTYPNSFKAKDYEETSEFYKAHALEYNYGLLSLDEYHGRIDFDDLSQENNIMYIDNVLPATDELLDIAESRPERALLPRNFDGLGEFEVAFPLDFASFRDIQRQRSAFIPNVILLPFAGMHAWYYDSLPEDVRKDIVHETTRIRVTLEEAIKAETLDKIAGQYITPMGFKVPVTMKAGVRAMTYILELRSSKHVHQTLRDVISVIGQRFHSTFGTYNLYMDTSPDELDSRRGEQDIVQLTDSEKFEQELENMPERKPDIELEFNIGEEGKLENTKIELGDD